MTKASPVSVIVLTLLMGARPGAAQQASSVLGGTADDATAYFGDPSGRGDDGPTFQPCPGDPSQPPRWAVSVDRGRVVKIKRYLCEFKIIDPETARAQARSFLPTDAVEGARRTTDSGWRVIEFQSAELGQRLPPDAFLGCSGDVNPPGTLLFAVSVAERTWVLSLKTCF
jgi:hypothetical protein